MDVWEDSVRKQNCVRKWTDGRGGILGKGGIGGNKIGYNGGGYADPRRTGWIFEETRENDWATHW